MKLFDEQTLLFLHNLELLSLRLYNNNLFILHPIG
jgi:hypothetical protein